MLDPLSATLGAGLAIGLREWIEWRLRIKKKQSECRHYHTFETKYQGMITVHCKDCKYQWPKEDTR